MRKYLKPAMEMEEFDVEDIITVSDIPGGGTQSDIGSGGTGGSGADSSVVGATAPIDLINLN